MKYRLIILNILITITFVLFVDRAWMEVSTVNENEEELEDENLTITFYNDKDDDVESNVNEEIIENNQTNILDTEAEKIDEMIEIDNNGQVFNFDEEINDLEQNDEDENVSETLVNNEITSDKVKEQFETEMIRENVVESENHHIDENDLHIVQINNDNDDSPEQNNSFLNANESPITPFGLLDLVIFQDATLAATHEKIGEKERIRLQFNTFQLLELDINVTSTYIIFHVPGEIANILNQATLSASYQVPTIIFPKTGEFASNEIIVEGNQIYMEFSQIITIGLIEQYRFTLNIDLDELPLSSGTTYQFYAQGLKDSLIDISLLDSGTVAEASLDAPHKPDAP